MFNLAYADIIMELKTSGECRSAEWLSDNIASYRNLTLQEKKNIKVFLSGDPVVLTLLAARKDRYRRVTLYRYYKFGKPESIEGFIYPLKKPEFKKCPNCQKKKKRESFYSNRTNRDFLSSYCAECSTKRTKEYLERKKSGRSEAQNAGGADVSHDEAG